MIQILQIPGHLADTRRIFPRLIETPTSLESVMPNRGKSIPIADFAYPNMEMSRIWIIQMRYVIVTVVLLCDVGRLLICNRKWRSWS